MIGKYNWLTLNYVSSTTPVEDDNFLIHGPLNYIIIHNPSGYTGNLVLSVCPNALDDVNLWVPIKTIICTGTSIQHVDSENLATIAGCIGFSSVFRLTTSTNATLTVYLNSYKH